MVDRGPDGLLELPEFPIQSGRLELAPHRAHLTDVDPADPQILLEELPEEREVQAERLLRLPVEARDEIEAREKPGHPVLATFAPDGIDHPDRREASIRVDVQVVRFRHARIRGLESERERGARGGEGHEIPHRGHGLLGMRDHHRRIPVVRV